MRAHSMKPNDGAAYSRETGEVQGSSCRRAVFLRRTDLNRDYSGITPAFRSCDNPVPSLRSTELSTTAWCVADISATANFFGFDLAPSACSGAEDQQEALPT